jgi:hypothetical protein
MLIKDVLALLTEYNTSKTNTTLAGQGGEKATGKNYDNIITGKAQAYKHKDYETKYGKQFPALAEMVKKLKSQAIKGEMLVNGPALLELQNLLSIRNPKKAKDGTIILPFGDNIRMRNQGNAVFIGYTPPDKPAPAVDIVAAPPAIDITK